MLLALFVSAAVCRCLIHSLTYPLIHSFIHSLTRRVCVNVYDATMMVDSKRRWRLSCRVLLVVVLSVEMTQSWTIGNLFVRHGKGVNNSVIVVDRRRAIKNGLGELFGAVAPTMLLPSSSTARNLPKSTGADLSQTGTVQTLIPVVLLEEALTDAKSILVRWKDQSQKQGSDTIANIQSTLSTIPKTEDGFKKVFDAYSEPVSYKQKFLDQNAFLVYYTKGFDGPGRPSIEDDLPELQGQQFGLRNEAWVAYQELLDEIEYYGPSGPDEENFGTATTDLLALTDKALSVFESYLSLAPPSQVEAAKSQATGP